MLLASNRKLCCASLKLHACTSHNPEVLINYADDMITQQLISGLKNQQHQSHILSESPTLPTLAQKIERLKCLESTEESTDLMRNGAPSSQQSINTPIKSNYKRSRIFNNTPQKAQPCRGCGKTYHEGKSMARKDYPTFNKNCNNCGIKGHFCAVCQKRTDGTARPNVVSEEEGTDSPSLASATFQDFCLARIKQREHEANLCHITSHGMEEWIAQPATPRSTT